tara:strand:- start:109 stop:309 length:201 start_codon:yes stop_codon:yes gene_type:complete
VTLPQDNHYQGDTHQQIAGLLYLSTDFFLEKTNPIGLETRMLVPQHFDVDTSHRDKNMGLQFHQFA